jgi:ABC-type multidrug transport system permease subunit
MPIWTLAKKDLRLLARDARAAIILLAMPLIFILILGLSLGEGFGIKPDSRMRVSILDLDEGYVDTTPALREQFSWFTLTPGVQFQPIGAVGMVHANHPGWFPHQAWSKVVLNDLALTAEIRVELIPNQEEAERLCFNAERPAVLVFGPHFSHKVAECSFLAGTWQDALRLSGSWPAARSPFSLALAALFQGRQGDLPLAFAPGINPFYRDGVKLEELDAQLIIDETQKTAASVIDQVAQVTLLRVILPWMIGRAFDRLSEPRFIDRLGEEVSLPVPRTWQLVVGKDRLTLNELLFMAASNDPARAQEFKQKVGSGVQNALRAQFPKYELTGKTWAALTRSEPRAGQGAEVASYVNESGTGVLKRGAIAYQTLVPSYTVMFAFFLVLTVGWLFVAERRQGTLKRLRAAPITRGQVLIGKLLPCFLLSVSQGAFLLLAGRVVFGMHWGPDQWSLAEQALWLLPVVFTTSLAAMGLALLVAALARTESQVAIYGTLLVLVLAGMSGCLMPRELMPEQMKVVSLVTPHAWALDAYRQLLLSSRPNVDMVWHACAALAGFGTAFLALAWGFLRLE